MINGVGLGVARAGQVVFRAWGLGAVGLGFRAEGLGFEV